MTWGNNTWGRKSKDEEIQEEENLVLKEKFIKTEYESLYNLKKLELPKEGEVIKIITKNRFTPFTFLSRILEKAESIDELFLTTYSISQQNIIWLKQFIEQWKIKNITLVICKIRHSDFKVNQLLTKIAELPNTKVIYTDLHCKIISLYSNTWYYTIEGSWNMSTVGKIEQYNIENNKKTFEFHKNWISNIHEIMTEKEIIVL